MLFTRMRTWTLLATPHWDLTMEALSLPSRIPSPGSEEETDGGHVADWGGFQAAQAAQAVQEGPGGLGGLENFADFGHPAMPLPPASLLEARPAT